MSMCSYKVVLNFTLLILLILYILLLMSFNRQSNSTQQLAALLEWINIQRKHAGKISSLFTFQQVLQQEYIYQILNYVDQQVFSQFKVFGLNKKICCLQNYFDRQFGKRMKWSYKSSLNNLNSLSFTIQLAKLSCFFSVHSKNNNEIINRILCLSDNTQKDLMRNMQKIEQKIENITQIRQILQQIQALEQQNNEYKTKIEEMKRINDQLMRQAKQWQEESDLNKKQVQKLRNQKCQVLSALKISQFSDYLDIYAKLKAQNEKNEQKLRASQTKYQEIETTNKQLEKRINSDCIVIDSLSQELKKLKQKIGIFLAYPQLAFKFKQSQRGIKNKENEDKKLFELDNTKQFKAAGLAQRQILPNQISYQQFHNQQLMQKLETMYKKYSQISSQMSELRQQNRAIKKENKKLQQILRQVQQEHLSFYEHYHNRAHIQL